MTPETRKQCSKCKDWKLMEEFHKEKSKALGVQSRCRFCKKLDKKGELNEAEQTEDAAGSAPSAVL